MALRLYQGRFRLEIRKSFFTQRVIGHWNREAVTGPSPTEFSGCLDNAVITGAVLCRDRSHKLGFDHRMRPFQLRLSHDAVIP